MALNVSSIKHSVQFLLLPGRKQGRELGMFEGFALVHLNVSSQHYCRDDKGLEAPFSGREPALLLLCLKPFTADCYASSVFQTWMSAL